jgi:hypothetical protein
MMATMFTATRHDGDYTADPVLLANRPFADCHSVGALWIARQPGVVSQTEILYGTGDSAYLWITGRDANGKRLMEVSVRAFRQEDIQPV